MNVLVIGSGGREHAMCYALDRSESVSQVLSCPGNGGIHKIAPAIEADLSDAASIIKACEANDISLVVIGPEAPLVDGLADDLRAADINVFGCGKEAAQLEGSKAFMKDLVAESGVPTALYEVFENEQAALAFAASQDYPLVIKADGLAAGKGVTIAQNQAEAEEAIKHCFSGGFGDAGYKVVIEEFLDGEEISVFVITDGEDIVWFGSAQDHKAVGEGDTGPNTGGMGTYTPAPVMTQALQKEITEKSILPTLKGLKARGITYQGVLFAGFMVTSKGAKLLEYNVRFGDPETQVLMPLLASDFGELCLRTATKSLKGYEPKFENKSALCVVMAANGYPGSYEKGSEIKGLDALEGEKDIIVFHAGTKAEDGKVIAVGGRVLGVVAMADSIEAAQQRAYQAVDAIDWPQGFCRRDIGWRALKHLKEAS